MVTLAVLGEDKYGRLLAEVYSDRDVNGAMLEGGHAAAYGQRA